MKQFATLTFLMFAMLATAQEGKFRVEGKILDEENSLPLEFANASLLIPADSSLAGGSTTDSQGFFSITARPGVYILRIQFISYTTKHLRVSVTQNSPVVKLGTIKLAPDSEILSEVIVTGQKGQMELELDKRVFNVSQNLQNVGSNAAEILDNLPSVNVDVDGNVSLRGNSGVRILVNGKPSGLAGISSPDALRQLQGDLIERVEVITSPSARYDAEGSAGIINIILKKEREKGLNGSVTGNAGYPANYGLSSSLNYRKGSVNLFGSYGINFRENPGGGYTDRISQETIFTHIDNDRLRSNTSHNIRFGADFNLNENNQITGSILYRLADESNTTDITYFDRDVNDVLFNNTFRRNVELEDDHNKEYQLIYKRTLGKEGHELTAEVQLRDNTEIENASIDSANLLTNSPISLYQRSVNDEIDRNLLMQLDYSYPISKGKKFDAGYRGTLREIANDYVVEQVDDQGNFYPLINFTNKFVYNEDVHALYGIWENKMEKWGYQVGLRMEQTFITTFLRETGETNTKDYLNAFPSAFISYKLDDIRTVQTSYSRRLSRPRFWLLNPFLSFTDPRSIRTGNPDLDPEYSDTYEIGMLSNRKKSSVYVGAYFRHTTGVVERIQASIDGINTVSTPRNIGIEDAFGLEGNISTDPTPWLNINGNANFYRAITEGQFQDIELDRDTYTARFRLNTRIKTGKIDWQLSGNYSAPEKQTQGTRKSMYYMDLGASMDVLKGKATLNLNAQDLFNTRKYRGTTTTFNLTEENEFQWRSRQVRLSFTYRINQKNKRESRSNRDEDFEEDF